jgi:hypothetical protein
MPLRRLDDEFDREQGRGKDPEMRNRRSRIIRTEEVIERADAREGVRQDGREDSRGSSIATPTP